MGRLPVPSSWWLKDWLADILITTSIGLSEIQIQTQSDQSFWIIDLILQPHPAQTFRELNEKKRRNDYHLSISVPHRDNL